MRFKVIPKEKKDKEIAEMLNYYYKEITKAYSLRKKKDKQIRSALSSKNYIAYLEQKKAIKGNV